jgi:peptidoglycan/LPS O-acetylase OafA/YrhL
MSVESVVRRTHRVVAGIFLLTIVPAAYFSFTGDPDAPHPLVYAPLLPLLLLIVTGSYQLVLPWTRRRRAGASAA